MPKCEFTSDFETLIDDFNTGSQRAIAALNDKIESKPDPKSDPKAPQQKPNPKGETEPVDEDDIFNSSLEQLFEKTKRYCRDYDQEYKALEIARKELAKEKEARNKAATKGKVTSGEPVSAEEENEELLHYFTVAADRLGKALENFTLRVRSQLVGRKDLGEKFARAANNLFVGLKKLDAEVDKFTATELKRKPKEVKELEVIPSKFLADFHSLLKKYPPDDDDDPKARKDPKLVKAIKDTEDRLKKIDTNNSFDRVTAACEAGQTEINGLLKLLGSDEPKLTKALKDLTADIEKYDNHMFLLSRMR